MMSDTNTVDTFSTERTDDSGSSVNTDDQATKNEETEFSAEYVRELRQENAERRTAAKDATERADTYRSALRAHAVQAATADILRDATDLGVYVDAWDDESGLPDAERIAEAARALVEAKPHLARAIGDVQQGYRDDGSGMSLVEALRGA